MHTHMHADTDREALYLRDHPLQCASEKSCLSAAQRQTGGLSGGVKDGGMEVWKAGKWSWIQRDSNYFSLLVFDTCQGTSVKTLQLAEQNDIERERVSVLRDWLITVLTPLDLSPPGTEKNNETLLYSVSKYLWEKVRESASECVWTASRTCMFASTFAFRIVNHYNTLLLQFYSVTSQIPLVQFNHTYCSLTGPAENGIFPANMTLFPHKDAQGNISQNHNLDKISAGRAEAALFLNTIVVQTCSWGSWQDILKLDAFLQLQYF